MSKMFIGNKEQKEKDFNIILGYINKNQKEIIEKIKTKFTIFDSEKRKYNLQMLSILWSTYLLTVGNLDQKEFSKEDLDLITSLTSEKDKGKINNFISLNNSFQANLNNNVEKQELYEANLLKMEKKKNDLKILLDNKEKKKKKKRKK